VLIVRVTICTLYPGLALKLHSRAPTTSISVWCCRLQ